MEFSILLNQYLERIDCTAKELSEAAGLSAAALSRYRTGERMPNHEQMKKLISGIVSLAQEKQPEGITQERVLADFSVFIEEAFDRKRFTENLNALLNTLDISVSDLAKSMNFDPSYLSRIRLGQRCPSDPKRFADGVCRFVVRKSTGEAERSAIAVLIGRNAEEIASDSVCFSSLLDWMCNGTAATQDSISDFLKKLDAFDLNEYIRAIHFDELKVPSLPFQLPSSKTYYGVEEMKQGELDFFKATALSKSTEDVLMCSDMPMEDMAKDLAFGKKWMFGIAMMLKKGLHLHVIHNIDRPFHEMLLGLESWIPIYMTGQVSPYFLKGKHNAVYCHFTYVSGQAALSGECVQGFHNEGKYFLTKRKEEVAYYAKRAARLLAKAQPLMEIYRQDSETRFHAFLIADARTAGARHNILSSLPIYTIPETLFRDILTRNAVSAADSERLLAFQREQHVLVEGILQENTMLDELPLLSREEFEAYPMALSLSSAFCEKEVYYTYEEYIAHLKATRMFAELHQNYTCRTNPAYAFRNLQIQMHEGKWVMVSKNKSPVIHFVIRHAKMLHAFENFIVPIEETHMQNEAQKAEQPT